MNPGLLPEKTTGSLCRPARSVSALRQTPADSLPGRGGRFRFRRGAALPVLAWGIPSVILWWLVGAWILLDDQRQTDRQLEQAGASLDRIIAESWPSRLLHRRLPEIQRRFLGSALPLPRLASAVAACEAEFPPQALRIFLFDRQGLLLTPASPAEKEGAELLFDLLRRPATAATDLDQGTIDRLGTLLDHPRTAIDMMQGQVDQLRFFPGQRDRWPDHGFFSWRPGEEPGAVAGLLVLMAGACLPEDEGLHEEILFPTWRPRSLYLALVSDRGPISLTAGLATDVFQACREALARQPSGLAEAGGWLALSRRGRGAELIGILPRPLPHRPWLWLLAAGHLGLLLSGLARSRRRTAVPADDPRPEAAAIRGWSLPARLGGLLLLGFGFPLGVAGALAWLHTEEAREEITATSRERAASRLDRLEAGFEGHLRDTELRLRRWVGEFEPVGFDPASTVQHLAHALEAGQLDQYYYVSSGSQVVAWQSLDDKYPGDAIRLLRLPPPERERQYRLLVARGRQPTLRDWHMIRDPRPWQERFPSIPRAGKKTHLRKLLEWLSREAVNAYNLRRGFPPNPTPAAGLVVSGMFQDELGDFAQLGIAALNQLREISGVIGNVYLFFGVMPQADRRGDGLLLLVFEYGTIVADFLQEACGRQVATAGSGLVALPQPRDMVYSYPTLEDGVLWRPLQEKIRLQPDAVLHTEAQIGSEAFDVVGRTGRRLPVSVLLAITPLDRLRAALGEVVAAAFQRMALALAFCLLLTLVTLSRLLPPVRDLANGVQAMREGRFELRLATDRADELGRLFAAFNRAMAHLAEMQLAAAVQARLMPPTERRCGRFRIVAHNQMTQATGGDFLDHCDLPDGRVLVVLGDVTGHGIGSALVTAMAKEAVRELGPRFPDQPELILDGINRLFREVLERALGMTCVLGIFTPASGHLRIANAGQSFPLVWRPGQPATLLETPTSYPLGFARRSLPQAVDLTLGTPEGPAAIVFYTDGLVEATDRSNTPFGYTRFAAAVTTALEGGGDPGLAIFAAVRRFSDPVPWADDASVLVIQALDVVS